MSKSDIWFRRFEIVFSAISIIAILIAIVPHIGPLTSIRPSDPKPLFGRGGDFHMRMNEIVCMSKGINPYDIWTGKINYPPYFPFTQQPTEEKYEALNAYPPWEYIFAFPLAMLPHDYSWGINVVLMLGCVFLLISFAIRQTVSQGNNKSDGLFAALFATGAVAYPLFTNFWSGNYDLPILTALIMMIYLLKKGHNILAGCCWAFAMVKPQASILFAIPLLWKKKFPTCVVAATICAVATMIASLMCHTSPIDLILQAPAAGAHDFWGSGTMPYLLCRNEMIPHNLAIFVGCLVGILLCTIQTFLLRNHREEFVFFLPAFVCAPTWTYATDYTWLLMWPFYLVIIQSLLKNRNSPIIWGFAILSFIFCSRFYCGYYFMVKLCSGILHFLLYDIEAHRVLVSINSTMALLIATAFFLWYAQHKPLPHA